MGIYIISRARRHEDANEVRRRILIVGLDARMHPAVLRFAPCGIFGYDGRADFGRNDQLRKSASLDRL